jgi:DUF1680 family protein
MTRHPHYQQEPKLDTSLETAFHLKGLTATRLQSNIQHWLLTAPTANPSILQIFRDRDRTPHRDLVPWAGEFAGKYLISAVQALRLTESKPLLRYLQKIVTELIETQHESGYLGCFPLAEEMIGEGRWDLWGQYHVMLGLYLWWQHTGDTNALTACRKAADHFCNVFLEGTKRVKDAGWEEMNESCIHIFTLLYADFAEPRYLQLVREIEKDWESPPSGDYVRTALAGQAFYQTPKPRWESLHSIQAIAELYLLTSEPHYRDAYAQIWWSIVEGDRHNTGGFSSGEQATGNPYHTGAIETCCTIAWMAVTCDWLRISGDARAADELEISYFNAVLGAQHPSGRWWTYNTPMDGERKASAHEIVFQARAGSPELNCCSVNAPRGIGCLVDWAVLLGNGGITLNYYGSGALSTVLPSGNRVHIHQKTDYPRSGRIRLTLEMSQPEFFVLSLRVPLWSQTTKVDGNKVTPQHGDYYQQERLWHSGDTVEMDLDTSVWFWAGEQESVGKASLYWGALLLAYDPRFDVYPVDAIPQIDLSAPPKRVHFKGQAPLPYLLLKFRTVEGEEITLCDYASAGACGNAYRSWLDIGNTTPILFSRENPLRAQRRIQ